MYPPSVFKRIAILASGEGTNAQALIDASASDNLGGGRVVLVVVDRSDAGALRRAKAASIEGIFLDPAGFQDRDDYGARLADELMQRDVEIVCLAGFMRILAPSFIKRFENRILNVHPALLPAFPGARAVSEAIDWGVRVTGVTVHLADEEVDHGPIILQECVKVFPNDDEGSLHERIKSVERRLYPEAVRLLVSGDLRIEGRRVSNLRDEREGQTA